MVAVVCAACLAAAPQAFSQTIQLPTFHYFTVATTVVVPDRGSLLLGGVDRASYGSSSFGAPGFSGVPGVGRMFGNRAIGSEVGSSGASVTATVIDLDELDRGVLGAAAARRSSPTDPEIARKASFLSSNISRRDPALLAEGSKEAPPKPAMRPIPPRDVQAEARELLRQAREAEARGHLASARVYYKRASLLAGGELRKEAQTRLAALTPRAAAKSAAPK
jgi:hypothetical protein